MKSYFFKKEYMNYGNDTEIYIHFFYILYLYKINMGIYIYIQSIYIIYIS